MSRIARRFGAIVVVLLGVVATGTAVAGAIYPIDRARILAGSRFDLKVEFDEIIPADAARLTVNGVDVASALGRTVRYVESEDGAKVSALTLSDVTIDRPGTYVVQATGGGKSVSATW